MSLSEKPSIVIAKDRKGKIRTFKRSYKNIFGSSKILWCFMTLLLLAGRYLTSKAGGKAFALIQPSSLRLSRAAFISSTTTLSLIFPTTLSNRSNWKSFGVAEAAPTDSSLYSISTDSSCQATNIMPIGYLNAADAAALDGELMSTPGYCLEQLMELAGMAVAEAVYQGIPPSFEKKRKILFICGPGNNGGDGLVAARHLFFFNYYDCTIVYPKRSSKQHFINLVKQCEDVGIPFLDEMPSADELKEYDAIVDSIFGFSFKGEPRVPFATIMKQMIDAQQKISHLQVISVDVPSGWNVDEGDVAKTGFVPDMLISLTTPKMCSKEFNGRHFVGGRFLPPAIANKYNVQMPPYPGTSQVMEVTRKQIEGELPKEKERSQGDGAASSLDQSWREDYEAYLAELYASEQEEADTPSAASSISKGNESNMQETAQEEPWELQYAQYCAEKEAYFAQEDQEKEAGDQSWLFQYAQHCAEKEAKIVKEEASYRKTKRKEQ